jgi:dihydroneopterin aldolase
MTTENELTIALEDMYFFSYHGVYPEEQKIGRVYHVSVYIKIDNNIDGKDKLSKTYNYEWIQEIVKEEMDVSRKLLETVAFHIAKKLRNKSPILKSGKIKIMKEGIPISGKISRSLIIFPF